MREYERAIYLVYGDEADLVFARIRSLYTSVKSMPPIEVWLHTEAGVGAEHVTTLQTD